MPHTVLLISSTEPKPQNFLGFFASSDCSPPLPLPRPQAAPFCRTARVEDRGAAMVAPVALQQPQQRRRGEEGTANGVHANGRKRKGPPIHDKATAGGEQVVEDEQEKGKQQEPKRKKRKAVFIYGNYRSYYGYRLDRGVNEDPRLATFKREWFEGKDCLDIGCNEGLIPISIAKKFLCRSILGIDIDEVLIKTAHWNLRKASRMENNNSRSEEASRKLNSEEDLFKRVSFLCQNFVENSRECSEKYDTILCLSVTKWVHLNWGDEGLINMFAKIWKLLRQGGILLLEPQPWSSYKRYYNLSKAAKENYTSIRLRPNEFREILLDKIGFRSAEIITDCLSGTAVGFDRPIFAFFK